MSEISEIARELREDYPAVDVTAVGFSRDFAGVGCCVIPQDRVLAIVEALDKAVNSHDALVEALCRIRDFPHDKSECEQAMSQIAYDAIRGLVGESA